MRPLHDWSVQKSLMGIFTETRRFKATAMDGEQERRVPLHEQVSTALRQRILSGDFGPHQQLPSEASLMREFGVSRVTIRQALRHLGDEGLVYSRQGRGTFVSAPRASYNLSALLGFHETMQGRPFVATSRVLEVGEIVAPKEAAAALKLKRGEHVFAVKRARCLNGRPVSLDMSYFPLDIGDRLAGQDLSRDIFPLLEERGVTLGRSRLWIEAMPCPQEQATDLAVAAGTPILQLARLTCSALERPVDYEHLYCRGDACQYRVDLRRHPY